VSKAKQQPDKLSESGLFWGQLDGESIKTALQ